MPCGKLAKGVDVKGVGGYIVGVGSLHQCGKRYRWHEQCQPKNTELMAFPEWALKMLGEPKHNGAPRSSEFYDKLVEPVLEGERNDRLTRLFGHLFGSAFPDRVVLTQLVIAFNRVSCTPPLSDEEVINIARSVAKCETKKRDAA